MAGKLSLVVELNGGAKTYCYHHYPTGPLVLDVPFAILASLVILIGLCDRIRLARQRPCLSLLSRTDGTSRRRCRAQEQTIG
jgi:hypothetical protein